MRFVHCSDVHLTADYRGLPLRRLGWRRWLALPELLAGGRAQAYRRAPQTLAAIAREAREHAADHFILSGDLTACALDSEFNAAREALGALVEDRGRCTVIPGNHDVYTPGSLRVGRFERYFGHLLESDLPEHCREGPYPFVRKVGAGAAVVGLCSARVPPVPGISQGFIGRAQLEGLAAVVADPRLAGRALLVVVHHAPLTPRGELAAGPWGLRDGAALCQLLPGPRHAVLHGHIHRRFHHAATPERPHLFGAGSSTFAGHEGYWVIQVEGGRVTGGRMQELAV
ncbi:metallophosphoesterase family protein [Corallococcus llansteffanensis]|uniref:Metallophosphoesterase n=1 Tax=Corallococcus llansteffanensis TaxID=2316731 RepID=A0A3A8QBC9_9BACT|nr:metallophosphoesterase [Corallococcus llansteffanensis]RKH65957.1 metallophosphoesterase [Corallococcus llansteffanensis]